MANCSQINNTTIIGTSAIGYDSTPLPCSGVQPCDGLNDILNTFDTIICGVKDSVSEITDNVTNITEEVMLISEQIIDINNQLNICCPTTTTTSSSTSSTSTTTSTTTTIAPTTTTTTTKASNCVTFYNGETTIQEIEYNDCSGVTQYTIIQPGATNNYCGCCGVTHASLVTVTTGGRCVSGACPSTTTTTSTRPPSTTTTSSSSTSTTSTSSTSTTSTSSTSTTSTSSTSTTSTSSTTTTTTTAYSYCPKAVVSTYPQQWNALTTTPDGTIYGCTLSGVVYKYPVGGPWSTVSSSGAINAALAADSLGNVYGAVNGGTLYLKPFSSSTFTPIIPFAGNDSWRGLYVDQADTLWTVDNAGAIYTRAVSATGFTYHGATPSSGARDITVAPNGDVYVCGPFNVWKQTGGTGAFASLPTSPGYWTSISAASNGDIICVGEKQPGYAGGIWIIYAGTTTFVEISCDDDVDWSAVRSIGGGQFYASQTISVGEGDGEVYIFG
jgi:hypothetical protein